MTVSRGVLSGRPAWQAESPGCCSHCRRTRGRGGTGEVEQGELGHTHGRGGGAVPATASATCFSPKNGQAGAVGTWARGTNRDTVGWPRRAWPRAQCLEQRPLSPRAEPISRSRAPGEHGGRLLWPRSPQGCDPSLALWAPVSPSSLFYAEIAAGPDSGPAQLLRSAPVLWVNSVTAVLLY